MTVYAYRCRECGSTSERTTREAPRCSCGSVQRRDYRSVQLQPVGRFFDPHFNHAVGKYVSTRGEFNDELKRASERASRTTGIDHDFVPTDHRDTGVPYNDTASSEVFNTRDRNTHGS